MSVGHFYTVCLVCKTSQQNQFYMSVTTVSRRTNLSLTTTAMKTSFTLKMWLRYCVFLVVI